jgi:hypothetical protein
VTSQRTATLLFRAASIGDLRTDDRGLPAIHPIQGCGFGRPAFVALPLAAACETRRPAILASTFAQSIAGTSGVKGSSRAGEWQQREACLTSPACFSDLLLGAGKRASCVTVSTAWLAFLDFSKALAGNGDAGKCIEASLRTDWKHAFWGAGCDEISEG